MRALRAARRFWLGLGVALLWAGTAAAGGVRWFDGGQPTPLAREALAWLADAASDGLRSADYDAAGLDTAMQTGGDAAVLDRRLDAAVLRYLTHLRRGRIDPRTIHHDFDVDRSEDFDPRVALDAAIAAGRLDAARESARPPLPQYVALREALGRYRAMADHPAWAAPLPAPPRPLTSGDGYAGLDLLAERLKALGDLDADAPVPARFDGALVDAVRRFQTRHAIAVDGVVGPVTLARLAVTPAARARQIELTMERLRWTPLRQGPRMIVINIPEFVLRAYEVRDGRIRVERTMKVVVGKAMDTRTPLFDEDMRFVEFSPYWNVPPSIARGELVPQLRRDPAAFERLGYEFVDPAGRADAILSLAKLEDVLAGRLRIRQRPGPRNALGDIKFVFPNRSHIFLHHTPATGLFERERRDFSHGCIRVEEPVALAAFVLRKMPEWTEVRIREAMQRGESSTLRLTEPVPVLIAYGTTLVKSGRIHFFDDLYGLDRLLDQALTAAGRIR